MFHPLGIREKRFGGPGMQGWEGEKGRLERSEKTYKGSERGNKLTPARENGIPGLNVTGTKAPTEAMERGDWIMQAQSEESA